MQYVWLALALLALVVGITVGRVVGFSPLVTATLAGGAAFVSLFPFMRRWMPRGKFAYWAAAAVIAIGIAWLLYAGFSRVAM